MKPSDRLRLVVDLKKNQERKALAALGASQKKLFAAQSQLEHLQQYRREYSEQYQRLSERSVGLEQLLAFRAFIDKLDQAIAAQMRTVEREQRDAETKRRFWENAHHHGKNLQKLYDKALDNEQRQLDQLEQQEMDDRASRAARNNGNGTTSA